MSGPLRVTVAYSPRAREVLEWQVQLPAGATVRDALLASGLAVECPEADLSQLDAGLWGRRVGADEPLRLNDRVELYRPLQVDPKVARRERFRKQGARATGLFAGKRPGAKPGY